MKWYCKLLFCFFLGTFFVPQTYAVGLEVPFVVLTSEENQEQFVVVTNSSERVLTYELALHPLFSWTASGSIVWDNAWFSLPHDMVVVSPDTSVRIPYEQPSLEEYTGVHMSMLSFDGVREAGVRPEARRGLLVYITSHGQGEKQFYDWSVLQRWGYYFWMMSGHNKKTSP